MAEDETYIDRLEWDPVTGELFGLAADAPSPPGVEKRVIVTGTQEALMRALLKLAPDEEAAQTAPQ